MREKIKVLIADDHELIRRGLERIISFEEDIEVVGEARDGREVLDILKSKAVDVLLLDINMPIINGIDVLKIVKKDFNNVRVILLTVENQNTIIKKAIEIGADGYILKDSAGSEIVEAIRRVYSGENYIDKSLMSILFEDIKSKGKRTNILDSLTKREREILYLISQGLSNKEIGERLFLSEKTVKNYTTNIFSKLDVRDRVQAAIIAIENHIEEYFRD
ncbi:response regulator [Caloramator australicus]|uniref:Stage 0 sporulation protein A homolog n=2 Tax=Caloramator TaxID=44258 RepID=I7K9V1_9CLOT|nr:response regulator transcription factor [Caloramator australicus]CCJ34430.1 regulatory protein, LuxR:Response regulator receiver [Caloramator australicus RC3]